MNSSKDGCGILPFPEQPKESTKRPNDIDRYVGMRIRQRRRAIEMSQEKLAETVGVTFQQLQKYEKGENRIGAGRLLVISEALGVPVSFLFEGFDQHPLSQEGSVDVMPDFQSLLSNRDGIALAQAFARIQSPAMRKALIAMAKAATEES